MIRAVKLNELLGTDFTVQHKHTFTFRIVIDPKTGAKEAHTDLPLNDASIRKLAEEF